MSTVRDTQGNILNPVGPGCERYTDENSLTVDWFATHPRPVEAKTEFQVTKIPATLPLNSGDTLKVVAPVAEALSAGITTSSLPQTAVTE